MSYSPLIGKDFVYRGLLALSGKEDLNSTISISKCISVAGGCSIASLLIFYPASSIESAASGEVCQE